MELQRLLDIVTDKKLNELTSSIEKVNPVQQANTYQGLSDGLGKIIDSNIVDVLVRNSKDEEEEEQVKLIKGDQQALLFLFEGGDHLTEGIHKLTQLAERYPNCNLGSYANAVLGLMAAREFKDFKINKVRKPDHKKAGSFFKKAEENVKGYWADSIFLKFGDIHRKDGEKDLMNDVLNKYINKFEEDPKNSNGVMTAKRILNEEM